MALSCETRAEQACTLIGPRLMPIVAAGVSESTRAVTSPARWTVNVCVLPPFGVSVPAIDSVISVGGSVGVVGRSSSAHPAVTRAAASIRAETVIDRYIGISILPLLFGTAVSTPGAMRRPGAAESQRLTAGARGAIGRAAAEDAPVRRPTRVAEARRRRETCRPER